jgi:hypothetical protein
MKDSHPPRSDGMIHAQATAVYSLDRGMLQSFADACVKCGTPLPRGCSFVYGSMGERYHLLCYLRVEDQVDLLSRFVRDHPGVSICYECLSLELGLFPATIELAAWQLRRSGYRITTAACSSCLLPKPVLGDDGRA